MEIISLNSVIKIEPQVSINFYFLNLYFFIFSV